ncbi:melanocortin receptor 5-like [Hemitrygon akajei]|uniref:Adrenocorticotropic hormone receptor n=1 Tax=Hemitrygon akajei TaxID=2704970 RepID=A0A169T0Y7_HEMAK|nr:melanocortin 2 receptor [Hemitrygon akajei]
MPDMMIPGYGTLLDSNGILPMPPDATISPHSHPTISPWLPYGTEVVIDTINQTNMNATEECSQIEIPTEVYLILGLVSLLENLLVVIAVLKNKKLHFPMYFFICSLAVSDILLCLSKAWEAFTISLVNNHEDLFTQTFLLSLDNVFDTLICISFLASIFNLAAITTDRYISIFHCLRYHNIMTGKRVAFAIAGIWVFCTATGILMINFHNSQGIISFYIIFFLLSVVLIVSLYIYMFLLAQMHARKIRILPGHTAHQGINFKGAFTVTVLLGVFIFCWAPLSLHFILFLLCPSDPYCACFMSLFQIDLIFIMCHSIIDPLIYAFRDPELSNTFKKMMFCHKKQWYFHASPSFLNI